jgi:purine-nucleoside phosphorylase
MLLFLRCSFAERRGALDIIPNRISSRVIITDDRLRAKMLAAHHLEDSALVYEQGDFLIYEGSYNGAPIAVVSTGFGSGEVLSRLSEVIKRGAEEIVYIGTCISTTSRHRLREVILAFGGSPELTEMACKAASRSGIPAVTCTVLAQDGVHPEEGGIIGGIIGGVIGGVIDGVTGALYEQAGAGSVKALSVLTVAENTKTGEKMEQQEIRSRLYPAARLVFEMFAV